MKNLYIDFDGVILDTITYLYRDFKETCKNYTEEEIKKFGVVKTQTPEEYYNEEIRRARISAMSHC